MSPRASGFTEEGLTSPPHGNKGGPGNQRNESPQTLPVFFPFLGRGAETRCFCCRGRPPVPFRAGHISSRRERSCSASGTLWKIGKTLRREHGGGTARDWSRPQSRRGDQTNAGQMRQNMAEYQYPGGPNLAIKVAADLHAASPPLQRLALRIGQTQRGDGRSVRIQ
jgi:hypothetical protein